ncbi:MAG: carboxypeptidase regulatory-like domain-containing protein, partial [Gemmatimonas sp.]
GPAVTVSGTVKDSLTGANVPDARITFLGTPFEGATDSSGTFVIGGVSRGEHIVEVSTPLLDSIGAVARTAVVLSATAAPLALFVPSLTAVMSATCGSADVSAFVIGRVRTRNAATVPNGLRVVAEWADTAADSTRSVADERSRPLAWQESPVDASGTFRLCGVPIGTPIALRTEADSASAWGAVPQSVQFSGDRRFARADLLLDSTVVMLASFSGAVIADTTGVPIENAEVSIADLGRAVLTNRRGLFRLSEIPAGPHVVRVKRVGYAPMMTTIDFGGNRAVEQRVLLNQAPALAIVALSADGTPPGFDERRKTGVGGFMGREDLDKYRGRRLGDVLSQVSGFGAAAQGVSCSTPSERTQGIMACACFVQVYLDDRLMNAQRPAEPFDASTIPVDDIAGVEFYPSAASTPARYNAPKSVCGTMLVWTRRR